MARQPYGEIIGLKRTMDTLGKADKIMLRESRKTVIKTADPIVKTARSRLPSGELGNWGNWRGGYNRGKASRGIRAQLRQERVSGMTGRAVIFRVVQNNAGGAIFDNAGSARNYSAPVQRSVNFVDMLTRKSGYSAQRALWPAALQHRKEVHEEFRSAAFNMSQLLNEELRSRGYSARGARMIVERGYA